MATDCTRQVTFEGDEFANPVVARFDLPHANVDGGWVLFKALDTELSLTRQLAVCLEDAREPGEVLHEAIGLLQQRILWPCGVTPTATTLPGWSISDPQLMVVRDPLTGLATHAVALRERSERARVARHDASAGPTP